MKSACFSIFLEAGGGVVGRGKAVKIETQQYSGTTGDRQVFRLEGREGGWSPERQTRAGGSRVHEQMNRKKKRAAGLAWIR